MLIELRIRNFAIIDGLTLPLAGGFNVLTGETGAGKSIILDALGLATGMRGDAGLVRRGAAQAMASAAFALAPDHRVWAMLDDKGLAYTRDEDLVLRRTLSADGRKKHGTEPVQFGAPPALFRSFSQCFCLLYCLDSFGDATR